LSRRSAGVGELEVEQTVVVSVSDRLASQPKVLQVGEGLACRHVAPRPFAEQDLHPLRHRGIAGASGCIAQQLQAIVVVLLDEAAAALAVLEGMAVSRQHGGEALECRDPVE